MHCFFCFYICVHIFNLCLCACEGNLSLDSSSSKVDYNEEYVVSRRGRGVLGWINCKPTLVNHKTTFHLMLKIYFGSSHWSMELTIMWILNSMHNCLWKTKGFVHYLALPTIYFWKFSIQCNCFISIHMIHLYKSQVFDVLVLDAYNFILFCHVFDI